MAKSDAEMAACDTGLTFRKMQHLGAEIADVGAQSTSSRAFNRASPGEHECTPQFYTFVRTHDQCSTAERPWPESRERGYI